MVEKPWARRYRKGRIGGGGSPTQPCWVVAALRSLLPVPLAMQAWWLSSVLRTHMKNSMSWPTSVIMATRMVGEMGDRNRTGQKVSNPAMEQKQEVEETTGKDSDLGSVRSGR